MPEVKLTEEEMQILLIVKKKQLGLKDVYSFLELFAFLLERDFFTLPKGGEKVARFDKDGILRQIETKQIDWRS